jgi:hypothetical protein
MLAVIRQAGSAGRYQAGTVCLIAGTRRLAGPGAVRRGLPAGICWSLPGGHSVLDRWDATSYRAGGGLPAGICWALPGGHSVLDRWESTDSLTAPGGDLLGATRQGAVCSTGTLWSQGRSQPSGPAGPAERRGPAGQSAGRVPGGARRRAPRRLRQARSTDSKGTGEPDRPVAGLGSLLGNWTAAGGGRCRGGGGPGALDGPGPSLHDSARSEQVPPGLCTDAFSAPRAGGPRDPCNTCKVLHLCPESIFVARLFIPPVLHSVIFFSPVAHVPLQHPCPTLCLGALIPAGAGL